MRRSLHVDAYFACYHCVLSVTLKTMFNPGIFLKLSLTIEKVSVTYCHFCDYSQLLLRSLDNFQILESYVPLLA